VQPSARHQEAALEIVHVRSEGDADAVRLLVNDYVTWLHSIYPGEATAVDAYFRAQDLPGQMRNLLTIFRPPRADCLLARLDGAAVGTVMVRPHAQDTCEMNRMFVRASARGQGVGRALVAELLETARGLGYCRMMLAAGPRHNSALRLYESFGFALDPGLPDTGAGEIEVRMVRDL
jgi:GNAT superfamily N-acetyltransferase